MWLKKVYVHNESLSHGPFDGFIPNNYPAFHLSEIKIWSDYILLNKMILSHCDVDNIKLRHKPLLLFLSFFLLFIHWPTRPLEKFKNNSYQQADTAALMFEMFDMSFVVDNAYCFAEHSQ